VDRWRSRGHNDTTNVKTSVDQANAQEGPMTDYAFDNAWQQARQRLTAIEAWLDPGTFRHLEERGVGPGWRCLEIGAGGGSVAEWLCDRVGPDGRVLATDLDTRFVEALDRPNLQVRRHDICRESLPAAAFDLVHTRLVVAHLPQRGAALDRMVAALKPGGWLVVEEMDFGSLAPDPGCGPTACALLEKAVAAHHRVVIARGFDPFYGRRVRGELRARGLVDVGTEGRVFCTEGGSPGAAAWRLTFEQLREELVATGAVAADDVAAAIRLCDDPSLEFLSQATVAAWGQRPAA
jgi:SAM-dependent methyltransferase